MADPNSTLASQVKRINIRYQAESSTATLRNDASDKEPEELSTIGRLDRANSASSEASVSGEETPTPSGTVHHPLIKVCAGKTRKGENCRNRRHAGMDTCLSHCRVNLFGNEDEMRKREMSLRKGVRTVLSKARVLNSTIPRSFYPPRSIPIELRSADCSVIDLFPAISGRFTDRFVKFD
jgi:hypothetical protein